MFGLRCYFCARLMDFLCSFCVCQAEQSFPYGNSKGRDTSLHPEVPYCTEGGGADKGMPTTFTEEYGICYLLANGSVPDSYCGTQIVAHEFFHSVHEVAIRNYDPEVRCKRMGASCQTIAHPLGATTAN